MKPQRQWAWLRGWLPGKHYKRHLRIFTVETHRNIFVFGYRLHFCFENPFSFFQHGIMIPKIRILSPVRLGYERNREELNHWPHSTCFESLFHNAARASLPTNLYNPVSSMVAQSMPDKMHTSGLDRQDPEWFGPSQSWGSISSKEKIQPPRNKGIGWRNCMFEYQSNKKLYNKQKWELTLNY